MVIQKDTKQKEYIKDLPVADKIQLSYALTRQDILTEEGLLFVECLVRDGLTMDAVAKTLGVSTQTFWAWRKRYAKLDEACRKGKELVDYQVESALLRAALGYKTKTTKVCITDKAGNIEVKKEKTVTEVGPNVTACLAWLNNRNPQKWRRNRDSSLELNDEDSGITINIIKGKKEDDDKNSEE